MPSLSQYRTTVQRLLGTGSTGALYDTASLNAYINTARGQVALEGQCVRALTPISGAITTITATGGSNYGAGTQVVIAGPDSPSGAPPFPNGAQASATVTLASGQISAVTVLSTGAGYFAPLVSFSGTGSGAVATAFISGACATVAGQEVYPYAQLNGFVQTSGAGIASVAMVNSVSIIFGNLRYTLQHSGWSKYQALARNYVGYQDTPSVFAQYGQGNSGSLYIFPTASQVLPMEIDTCCVPVDLADDTTPDAIPSPWDVPVSYYAAHLAFSQSQRFADADRMFAEYEKFMKRARQYSQPKLINNWYGRPY